VMIFEYVFMHRKKNKKNLSQLPPDVDKISVSVNVEEKDSGKKKKTQKPLFYFWFHTSFIKNPFRLFKSEIDGVRKAKHPEMFAPNFAIALSFEKRQADIESGA